MTMQEIAELCVYEGETDTDDRLFYCHLCHYEAETAEKAVKHVLINHRVAIEANMVQFLLHQPIEVPPPGTHTVPWKEKMIGKNREHEEG